MVEVNEDLADSPESVNNDSYAAWLFKIKLSDVSELDEMMDAATYSGIAADDSH